MGADITSICAHLLWSRHHFDMCSPVVDRLGIRPTLLQISTITNQVAVMCHHLRLNFIRTLCESRHHYDMRSAVADRLGIPAQLIGTWGHPGNRDVSELFQTKNCIDDFLTSLLYKPSVQLNKWPYEPSSGYLFSQVAVMCHQCRIQDHN